MQGSAAQGENDRAHTFGKDCPHCGDGSSGVRCDLSTYSPRRVRFILAHREAYEAAYLSPDGHAAASHEQERLEREYHTLPPRHSCTCRCPNENRGYPRCSECKLLDAQRVNNDIPVEIGRTSRIEAPMPSPVMLDLARAEKVLGKAADAVTLATYMSLDGVVSDAVALRERRSTFTTGLVCLMCARPGTSGQRSCRWCGGSLVAEESLTA